MKVHNFYIKITFFVCSKIKNRFSRYKISSWGIFHMSFFRFLDKHNLCAYNFCQHKTLSALCGSRHQMQAIPIHFSYLNCNGKLDNWMLDSWNFSPLIRHWSLIQNMLIRNRRFFVPMKKSTMEIVCIFIPTTSVITNEFTKKVERERDRRKNCIHYKSPFVCSF